MPSKLYFPEPNKKILINPIRNNSANSLLLAPKIWKFFTFNAMIIVIINGIVANRENKPMMSRKAQKNSAKMAIVKLVEELKPINSINFPFI